MGSMKELLWLIVALPFAGSLILVIAGKQLSRLASVFIGVGSISLSAVLTILVGISFLKGNPDGTPYVEAIWQWMNVAGLSPDIAFHLDGVSLTFIFVVTFVGSLIHLYSAQFMRKD